MLCFQYHRPVLPLPVMPVQVVLRRSRQHYLHMGGVMIKTRLPEDAHERLEEIIRRMQKIQRAIKASRQPASMLELAELKSLGTEYARTVAQLATPAGRSQA
jgi:hypothetical protein